MQGFVMGVNPLLNALSRSGLKQPVNGGGCVEDDQAITRVLRSSCTFFLHQADSIDLDGNRLALMQTRA